MPKFNRVHYYENFPAEWDDHAHDQSYHQEMRLLHNRGLHTWGVIFGLNVQKENNEDVKITPGLAMDNSGQELELEAPELLELAELADGHHFVTISYDETYEPEDEDLPTFIHRVIEGNKIELVSASEIAEHIGKKIILARVLLKEGKIESLDDGEAPHVRRMSGATGYGYFDRVGVGTMEPGASLHLNGPLNNTPDANPTFKLTSAPGTGTTMTMGLRYGDQDNAWINGYGSLVLQPDGGKVGIGAETPDSTLEVHSQDDHALRLRRKTWTEGDHFGVNTEGNPGSSFLSFSFNEVTNRSLVIHSSGNIGVGTPNPGEKLTVVDNGSGRPAAFIDQNGDGWGLRVATSGTGTTPIFRAEAPQNEVRMIVNADGNVGIGTTAPNAKIHVHRSDNKEEVAHFESNDNLRVLLKGGEKKHQFFRFYETDHGRWEVGNSSAAENKFYFNPKVAHGISGSALVIQQDGNIGIGTASPTQFGGAGVTLDVHGGIRSEYGMGVERTDNYAGLSWTGNNKTDEWYLGVAGDSAKSSILHNNSEKLTIQADGNVGIRTTQPRTPLHIAGHLTIDTGSHAYLYTGTGKKELNRYLGLLNSPDSASASGLKVGGVLISDSFAYANPGKNDLVVKGKIGVGTASPAAKLHIAGKLKLDIGEGLEFLGDNDYFGAAKDARVFRMIDTNGGGGVVDGGIAIEGFTPADGVRKPILAIRGGGNVGVGVVSPNAKLSVDGDIALAYGASLKTMGMDANLILKTGWNKQVGDFLSLHVPGNGQLPGSEAKMLITEHGQVGIGTTSPSAQLDIKAGTTAWRGWYEAIRLSQDAHSAITHPGSGLMFGLHSGKNRAFYFGDEKSNKYHMQLNADSGVLQVNGALQVSGNANINGAILCSKGALRDSGGGWVRTYENTGWYNQTHGGGWHMTDSTWIRSYNGKSIYQNTGILRTDGELQVGPNGNRFVVNGGGKVGIGTSAPKDKLDVHGTLRFNGNVATRLYGAKRTERDALVLRGNWHELEVKGRVIDWTGSNLHIGYDNDHTNHYIEIGRKVGFTKFMSGGGASETMRITGGKVGIGTNAPDSKFHVKTSSSSWQSHFVLEGKDSGSDWNILVDSGLSGTLKNALRFKYNAGSEALALSMDGKVGIGRLPGNAKLSVSGNAYFSEQIETSSDIKVHGAIVAPEGVLRDNGGGWIRTYGSTGWYSQTYGGGWRMTDSTWIRTYGNKNIYQNTGVLRTDGELQVGSSGNRFRVRTNGNVGIGVSAPNVRLHVNGDLRLQNTNSDGKNPPMKGTEFLINWNKSGGKGETCFWTHRGAGWVGGFDFWHSGHSQPIFEIRGDGKIKVKGGTVHNSDIREKRNIKPLKSALQKVLQLRGVSFNWKEAVQRSDGAQLGVIAQEVEKIIPSLVEKDRHDENAALSVNYNGLIPLLIEAIKEQQKIIDEIRTAKTV